MKVVRVFFLIVFYSVPLFSEPKSSVSGNAGYLFGVSRQNSPLLMKSDSTIAGQREWKTNQTAIVGANFSIKNKIEIFTISTINVQSFREDSLGLMLSQIYIKYNAGEIFSLVMGKQRFGWGNGRLFTVINEIEDSKNPFELSTSEQGVFGVSTFIIANESFGVNCMIQPDEYLYRSTIASKADFLFSEIDGQIGFVRNYDVMPVLSSVGSKDQSIYTIFISAIRYFDNLALFTDIKWKPNNHNGYMSLMNTDTSIFRFKNTFPREMAINFGITCHVERHFKYDIGIEYLYNGMGLDDSEAARVLQDVENGQFVMPTLLAALKRSSVGIGCLRKNYLGLSVSFASQRVGISGYAILNCDTRDALLNPQLSFEPNSSYAFIASYEKIIRSNQMTEFMFYEYSDRISLLARALF